MIKLFVLIVSLFSAFNCHAEEVRISCLFDPPIATPDMDTEANELRKGFQATNGERVVILELTPPKMLNEDLLSRLFPDGPPRVSVDNEHIVLTWSAFKNPRQPAMSLTVNRFSLEASEFFQIEKLGPKHEVFNWIRNGKCKIDNRKF